MKAHLALFGGGGEPKNEALLFQSTVDITFKMHTKHYSSLQLIYTFKTRTKHTKNAKTVRLTVHLYYSIELKLKS